MDTLSIGEAYRQRFLDHAITLTRYSMSGTPAEGTIDFSAAGTSAAWAAYLESANQEAMPGALVSWYIRVRNERIESTLKVRYKDE
jgi:hypothetical protein